ncbi:MAG: phage major tail tube protein [Roseburia sp.]|nr:phage major tail tube protein [Roseburia sp.]
MKINEVVHNYKLYNNNQGNRVVGVGDEFAIPGFDMATYTVKGAGFLGEFEQPVPGHIKSIETEIPFMIMDTEAFEMLGDKLNITIRGSYLGLNTETNDDVYTPVRIVMKGKNKGFEGGKLKLTEGTETKLKAELWYCLIEIGGESMFELDKFNSIYKVYGKDMLAEVNKYC